MPIDRMARRLCQDIAAEIVGISFRSSYDIRNNQSATCNRRLVKFVRCKFHKLPSRRNLIEASSGVYLNQFHQP